MKITYIAHSGFCVELEKHVLLFDYFTGELPSWDKEKTILVFASHKHQDHFSLRILELRKEYPHIHYFFGNDIKLKPDYLLRKKADPEALSDVTVMKAHEQTGYGGESQAVTVRTLKSTDEGVAFLVEAEGKTFYHAGDLNWWHWEGEPASWNRNMETGFRREIDSIAGERFDAAFVPLDPRLEAAYGLGMDYFLQKTSATHVFPMHMWRNTAIFPNIRKHRPDGSMRRKSLTSADAEKNLCFKKAGGTCIWNRL